MNAVVKIKKVLIDISIFVANISLIAMLILIMTEVFMRFFVGKSTMISMDFAGYFMGITFLWGGIKAFEDGSFVRVDILYDNYKGKLKKIMTVLFDLIFLFFLCNVTYYFSFMIKQTINLNMRALNIYETPLIYPRAVLFVGMIIFISYAICKIIEDIMAPIQKYSTSELEKQEDKAVLAKKLELAGVVQETQEEVTGV